MRAAVLILAAACGCSYGSAEGGTRASKGGAPGNTEPAEAGSPEAPAAPATSAAPSASGTGAATATATATDAPSALPASPPTWAQRLEPIVFHDVNTLANVTLRLYKNDGSLDEDAAAEVERVLFASKESDVPHLSRRLLQLVVKTAAHFEAHEVQVISSHRGSARKGSRHRTGEAIDFVFPGISPKTIAAFLRTLPRAGVGEYVHPRSQFVHLDVREQSYHWIDGSPPRRSWKEHPLPDPTSPARDAAYLPEQDLPDTASAR
jgi:uncharacterized protein YcbK (DUF882 family)